MPYDPLRDPSKLYEFGNGDYIGLFATPEYHPETQQIVLSSILTAYGCYPPALEKIFDSLKKPGRYDCVVKHDWFRSQYRELRKDLDRIGIKLEIFYLTLRSKHAVDKETSKWKTFNPSSPSSKKRPSPKR